MPELTNEDILAGINIPHNRWRLTTKPAEDTTVKTGSAKERVLHYIGRLRKLQMPLDEIKMMIADFYWDAFVQHELQVKESTGKSVKEFFLEKAKAEAVEPPVTVKCKGCDVMIPKDKVNDDFGGYCDACLGAGENFNEETK